STEAWWRCPIRRPASARATWSACRPGSSSPASPRPSCWRWPASARTTGSATPSPSMPPTAWRRSPSTMASVSPRPLAKESRSSSVGEPKITGGDAVEAVAGPHRAPDEEIARLHHRVAGGARQDEDVVVLVALADHVGLAAVVVGAEPEVGGLLRGGHP